MEINYLHRADIDENKWNNCIHTAYNSLIYAYSWYLDEVCDDWDALVMGDYVAVMPLPVRKKWGFTYTYQPFFCQQLGVFASSMISTIQVDTFFKSIPRHFSFIDLQVNIYSQPGNNKVNLKQKTDHHLPLITTYEKLYAGYNDNTRRNLKKAAASKITVMENADPASIIRLYKDNYASKTPEIKDHDYMRLNRLVNTAVKMGGLKAWGAYDEHNTLCAGVLILTDHNYAYYLLGGGDNYGLQNGAMHAIFDGFIKKHAGHDLVLDFEGSEIEGIARFYRGLGAKPVYYYSVKQNRLPGWIKWIKS